MEIPFRLANGAGNPPDANKWNSDYDWLTSLLAGDFVVNGGMELWNAATSFANPATGTILADGWVLRKSGVSDATANISREATIIDDGAYSAKIEITGAGSDDAVIAFDQSLYGVTSLRNKTLSVGFMIRVSTATKVRIRIADGTSTVYTQYHTGGGTYEHLHEVITVAAAATTITISVEVDADFTGDVYIDSGYAYSVPTLITQEALEALAWSPLLSRSAATDLVFAFGVGPVIADLDGTGRLWRVVANDGQIGLQSV